MASSPDRAGPRGARAGEVALARQEIEAQVACDARVSCEHHVLDLPHSHSGHWQINGCE